MVKAESSILIEKPTDRVFEFVAENFFENYPRWSPEVVDLVSASPPPIRVGTAGRQVRIDQGRRTESTFRVSALEKGQFIVFEGTSNPFRIVYRFLPLQERTRLVFTFEVSRLEFYMRPFEKLVRQAVQEGAERVVYNIKGLIEAET